MASTVSVLNPVIHDDTPRLPLATPLAALRNARIAFVDNSKVNADVFLERVKTLLGERYGVAAGNTVRKLAPKDDLTAADLALLGDCDAVIQGFGD
jgi:hypothetical protein